MNIFKLRTAHCFGIQQTTVGFRPEDFEPGNEWDKNTKKHTVQTVQIDKPIKKEPSYHQFMLTLTGINAIILLTNIALMIKK